MSDANNAPAWRPSSEPPPHNGTILLAWRGERMGNSYLPITDVYQLGYYDPQIGFFSDWQKPKSLKWVPPDFWMDLPALPPESKPPIADRSVRKFDFNA